MGKMRCVKMDAIMKNMLIHRGVCAGDTGDHDAGIGWAGDRPDAVQ